MSVLERRFSCPGSMRMEDGRPDTPGIYARRGTHLHEVAAACLAENLDAIDTIPDDPDGAEIVQAYIDVVRDVRDRTKGTLYIEQQFRLAAISDLYYGTADAVIIAPPTLHVFDLKTGAGHAVPVRRPDGRPNFQLSGYGLGAFSMLAPDIARQIEEIELCVVQPRLGPPRSTVMPFSEIHDLAADLIDIANAALDPSSPLVAGDHCAFCRAAPDCPALRMEALAAAQVEFDIVDITTPHPSTDSALGLPDPAILTPEQLARAKDAADLIETWIDAVRGRAKQLADAGVTIPGFKLVDKRARRVWVDETAATEVLNDVLPHSERYVVKLVSPAQAEKALKRLKLKLPKQWTDIVTLSRPGTTLVPDADARPAVAPRIATEFEVEQIDQGEQ